MFSISRASRSRKDNSLIESNRNIMKVGLQRQVLGETSPSQNRDSSARTSPSSASFTSLSPMGRPPTQNMDMLRQAAYRQRQDQRRNRVVTPKMLKSRPIENKQNVVMRSKHKNSANSVTSDKSHMSDATEKATNSKTRLKRNKSFNIDRLDTLESVETFESLKNDAENKMAMANTMLPDAMEEKRKAQLEIAERLEAAKNVQTIAKTVESELQRQEQEEAVEERKRYQEMAVEAEEKQKAHAEAAERIRILEAEKERLKEEHKAAVAEARRQAEIAACEEKKRLEVMREAELHRQAEEKAAEERKRYQKMAVEAEEKRKAHAEAAERIRILEAEKERLKEEHKAAVAEARRQAEIAACEEKKRLEVVGEARMHRQAKEKAVEERKRYQEMAFDAEEKRKAHAEAAERIRILEAEKELLKKEHKTALAELDQEKKRQVQVAAAEEKKRLKEIAAYEEKKRLEVMREAELHRQAEEKAAEERKRYQKMAVEAEEKRKAHAEAAERIRILEAEKERLKEEHKAAVAEARRQAEIAACEEKKRLEVDGEAELHRQAEEKAVEERKRYQEMAFDAEEKRKAHAEAAERISILEAEKELLEKEHKTALAELDQEKKRQVQVAAAEEKKRLAAAFDAGRATTRHEVNCDFVSITSDPVSQRGKVSKSLGLRFIKESKERDFNADAAMAKLLEQKKQQLLAEALERIKMLEAEKERLEGEHKAAFAEAQKQENLRIKADQIRLQREAELRIEADIQAEISSIEQNWRLEADSQKWLNLRRLRVGRQAAEKAKLKSSQHKTRCGVSSDVDHSCLGFIISEGVSDCSSEEGDINRSNSSIKENLEVELSSSNVSNNLGNGAKGLGSQTFRELEAAGWRGNAYYAMEKEEMKLAPFLEMGQQMEKMKQREEVGEISDILTQVKVDANALDNDTTPFEDHVKDKTEKPKKVQTFFKSLRRGMTKKDTTIDNRVKIGAIDVEQTSEPFVKRLELELELLKLSKEIARVKEKAYCISKEVQSKIQEGITITDREMGTVVGKTIKEDEEYEEIKTHEVVRNDHSEEGIEVMSTLSQAEHISVYTPLSVDESAFAYRPTLLQRTGSFIKRHQPLHKNRSFTKLSKEEKKILSNARAKAKADNHFQETFEHDDFEFVVPENNDILVDPKVVMYDEDITGLVAKNTYDPLSYEDEDDSEFVQTSQPRNFIKIPSNLSMQRVRSKDESTQTSDSPSTGSPRIISPRVNVGPRQESFLETAALFGAEACLGAGRVVLTCADTCNKHDPDSRVHELLERTSSHSRTSSHDSSSQGIGSYSSQVISPQVSPPLTPVSPPSRSMFQCGNIAYSQDEEELTTRFITRAFVSALRRVDAALNIEVKEDCKNVEHPPKRHSRSHSKRRVEYSDILSVDGQFVNAMNLEENEMEQVPRSVAVKPKMQTPRGREDNDKRGNTFLGKMFKRFKKPASLFAIKR